MDKIYKAKILLSVCCLYSLVAADVSHVISKGGEYPEPEETSVPPRPYVFSYSAGRAPGHVDRKHTEVSDGSGTIRGSYSYVDPNQEIRTVQYVADEHGFHPELSHEPEQTEAFKRVAAKHLALYNKIAKTHNNPQEIGHSPVDSASVAQAKNAHFNLFEKIAAEHALIAQEREIEQLKFESTSEISLEN